MCQNLPEHIRSFFRFALTGVTVLNHVSSSSNTKSSSGRFTVTVCSQRNDLSSSNSISDSTSASAFRGETSSTMEDKSPSLNELLRLFLFFRSFAPFGRPLRFFTGCTDPCGPLPFACTEEWARSSVTAGLPAVFTWSSVCILQKFEYRILYIPQSGW